MDIDKYSQGLASGVSKVILHGKETLLITVPGGFSADTGAPLPVKEQGYQLGDVERMREEQVEAVAAAEAALVKAQERLAAFDLLHETATALISAKK